MRLTYDLVPIPFSISVSLQDSRKRSTFENTWRELASGRHLPSLLEHAFLCSLSLDLLSEDCLRNSYRSKALWLPETRVHRDVLNPDPSKRTIAEAGLSDLSTDKTSRPTVSETGALKIGAVVSVLLDFRCYFHKSHESIVPFCISSSRETFSAVSKRFKQGWPSLRLFLKETAVDIWRNIQSLFFILIVGQSV